MENIVIVIPSLNPDEKLINVVEGLLNVNFNKIVLVDDGSDKEHKAPFNELISRYSDITLLTHECNKGKGAALKTAFKYIANSMHDIRGIITVDGDGQHAPKDVYHMAEVMLDNPNAVILGCRDFTSANVPAKSLAGNRTIQKVLKLFFKVDISDTQTGMRGIPYQYLHDFATHIDGDRYEYETLMFLYLKEQNIDITEITIDTIYENNNEGSHYHPVKDSLRIARMLIKYATFIKQILSSLLSTISDLAIFYLLSQQLEGQDVWISVMVATIVARICSCTINYTLNRHYVFKSKRSFGSSFPRYVTVAVFQMMLSYLFTTLLTLVSGAHGIIRTLFKAVVDSTLFIVSYFVQKKWVF